VKYVPPWFPGASFKKEASDARRLLEETANTPFQFSVQEMVTTDVYAIRASGTDLHCPPGKGDGASFLSQQKYAGYIYDGSRGRLPEMGRIFFIFR
jgi:hypothetical protein